MKKEVKVHQIWLDDEEALMIRLGTILAPSISCPPFKKDNHNWQLDGTNDWWACVEDNKLNISCRYETPRFETFCNFVEAWLS